MFGVLVICHLFAMNYDCPLASRQPQAQCENLLSRLPGAGTGPLAVVLKCLHAASLFTKLLVFSHFLAELVH